MRRHLAFCLRSRRLAFGTLIVLWGTFFLYILRSWGWSWAAYLAPIPYLALAPVALIRLPKGVVGEVYAVEKMTKMAKFCAYSPAYLVMSLAALATSAGLSALLISSFAQPAASATAYWNATHSIAVTYFRIENMTVINGTYVLVIRDLNTSAQYILYGHLRNASQIGVPQIIEGYIVGNSSTPMLFPPAKPLAVFAGLYASLTAAAIYTALFAVLLWGRAEEMQEIVALAKGAYEKAKGLLA